MSALEIFLIGIGLSMDAFAVAIGKGLSMTKVDKKQTLVIAAFFGGFQALMPFLGWALGSTFASKIKAIDHWIAFILLSYIGVKMIADALKEMKAPVAAETDPPLDLKELLLMAIATSIDALAVGVTFSFLEVNILAAIAIIGCTTFVLSALGVFIGNIFGSRYKTGSQIVGGVILVAIGLHILIQHLIGAA